MYSKGRKFHYVIHDKKRMSNKNKCHGAIRNYPNYSYFYPNQATIFK